MQQGFSIMWDELVRFIEDKDSFLLSTHVNPEGDAIGSEVALKIYLESLGKKVFIVNSDPIPRNCRFLDPNNDIITYSDGYTPDIMESIDGVIILDVNNWMHLGRFGEVLQKSSKPRACIDHHEGLHEHFAEVTVSDITAASAGVLVYELIKHMGGTITTKIAEAVYASLITDTGTFRFSNTDERAFMIAADLCSKGVEPFKLHRAIFANKSWSAAQLIGPVLNTLRSAADGRLAWICMTRQMLNDANAEYEDSDSLLGLVRAIKGVECCLFFKETKDGSIKVSVRSNGKVNAHEIAQSLGGGGHRMAAGMNIKGSMDEAVEKVVKHCLSLDELTS